MYVLGLESSCDETSAAIVEMDGETRAIRANIVASQIETPRLYGGVVPEIASRAHIEAISSVTYEAMECAGLALSDIDLVAVTAQPGLIGALLVGVNFAKSLAAANKIPLVAVDHIKGQPYITLMTTHFETVKGDKDVRNLQVMGLAGADFDKLDKELRYAKRIERIKIISKYMDYRLTVVDDAAEIPKDALNIAKMLGIDKGIIEKAKDYIK